LGGCPSAPGASGNITTEDWAFMLSAMGLLPGVDLPALTACRDIVSDALPGEQMFGFVADAGMPKGWAVR